MIPGNFLHRLLSFFSLGLGIPFRLRIIIGIFLLLLLLILLVLYLRSLSDLRVVETQCWSSGVLFHFILNRGSRVIGSTLRDRGATERRGCLETVVSRATWARRSWDRVGSRLGCRALFKDFQAGARRGRVGRSTGGELENLLRWSCGGWI